ncbi:isochorismatase family protein [Klebsiella pneumoniae]|uniref:isochorismatase family protein n=1 Tax=Klebsiella pneumoniae TaxID=573 RepID=UPI003D06F32E
MKAVGASAGTLRRLSAFISRRVCTAASTPCAAGPCCSPTFRSAKSMNMRRRRRIAKSHRISRADDFAPVCPSEGLAIERGDLFYACPRASVFYGTALDADLRTRGVSTLVMAGISTTGVVLSSVAWASDADYDVRLVQDCCYDPGSGCPRSSVAFRVRRTCTGRVIFGPRMIAAIAAGGLVRGQGQSKSGCGHRGACNSQKPIAVAEVL